jgi:hypothetical protein
MSNPIGSPSAMRQEPSTSPPDDCDDGHSWRFVGSTEDGDTFHVCRNCGEESET